MRQRVPYQRQQKGRATPRTRTHITGTASVRYLPSGLFIQLEAPWNEPFQREMKKSIPTKKRIWDNNDKCWYIIKDQFDKLAHLLDKFYTETILLDFPDQEVKNDSWTKLFLIPGAPIELVQSAYKVMSKKHHPDLGGSTEKMQNLNLAYKDIMGELTEKGGQDNV
ncbi:MAG: hypothetical protein GY841_14160 [FCB group bacterium]|nr:hypothetical protein [FCB group bacterium]